MARNKDNAVVKKLLLPVLGAQLLTTREPDGPMVEVALAAFKKVRELDGSVAVPEAATEELIV
jgi:uncharacterized protein YqhQ